MVFVGLFLAPFGNLTAHEDAVNDNHSHSDLADGTVVSACWYEFPLPDDYQPGNDHPTFLIRPIGKSLAETKCGDICLAMN